MPLFGRKFGRNRARPLPPYRSGDDCSPWVLDGVWPSDLNHVTPETHTIAEYLRNDLLRIAEQANDKLRTVARAGLDDRTRTAEEQRLLNVGRAFAVLRVESTVRLLRRELGFRPELAALEVGHPADPAPPQPPRPAPQPEPESEPEPAAEPESAARHRRREEAVGSEYPAASADSDPTPEVIDAPVARALIDIDPPAAAPPPNVIDIDVDETTHSVYPPARPDTAEAPIPVEPDVEPAQTRLTRLLRGVARQEPSLRWGVGERDDGSTLLVTDLAHGWIPPGIDLPTGVELLPPGRHTGNVATLLQDSTASLTYAPGERLGAATQSNHDAGTSETPRLLDMPDDLGGQVALATQGRPGLPRLAHTLATVAADGGLVPEPEVDVLRVHMDTARYQLLANYPNVDNTLLLNCMLLAAAEAIATDNPVPANYHFAWFRALSTPAVTGLKSGS